MGQQVQRWSNRFHQRDKLLMLRTAVIEGGEGVREAKAVTSRKHEDAEQSFCLVSAIENRHFVLLTSQSMLSSRACNATQSAKYFCPKEVHVRSRRTKLDVSFLSILFVQFKASVPGHGKHSSSSIMDSVLPKGD